LNIFSSREIATFFWIFVLLIWAVSNKDIRKSIKSVIKSFFKFKLILPIIILLIYLSVIFYLLYLVNVWNFNLLKDSIIWSLFSATVLIFQSVDIKEYRSFIKKFTISAFKIVFLFEFLVNLYTFHIVIEFFMVPVMVFLTLLEGVSQGDNKFLKINKVIHSLFVLIGFAILISVAINVFSDIKQFGSFEMLQSVLFAPVLSILIFPYIYIFKLIITYEVLFIRIHFVESNDKAFHRKIRIMIVRCLKINLKKSLTVLDMGIFNIMSIKNNDDIERMKKIYKKI